jgi:Na+/H+-dicarboxylate symporter
LLVTVFCCEGSNPDPGPDPARLRQPEQFGDMTPQARFSPSVAGWSLAALGLGTVLGLVGRGMDVYGIRVLSDLVAPLGGLWMNALQMTVVPLVVAQLLAALVRPSGTTPLGSLGGRALGLFLVMLVAAGILTIFPTRFALSFFTPPEGLLESLQLQAIPAAIQEASEGGIGTFSEWIVALVPRNPLEAAVNGDLLQVLIFTVLIGVAAAHLPDEQRDPLARVFRSLADTMMILISWIMWGTPVGVFAIMLALTLGTGLSVVGLVGLFFILVCGVLVLAAILLYPLSSVLGKASIVRFAKAALPSQIVAATTQSSLASLPALIEGGRDELDLPEESTGFVLPLCVSTFKLNQTVSPTVRLLFLAHFFNVHLSVGELAMFILGSVLIGFTSVGIPRGTGGWSRVPLYLAVGIPIEAYVMVDAIKYTPIYDACATVLNVTGDMSAATLLSRGKREGARKRAISVPDPAPATETSAS